MADRNQGIGLLEQLQQKLRQTQTKEAKYLECFITRKLAGWLSADKWFCWFRLDHKARNFRCMF